MKRLCYLMFVSLAAVLIVQDVATAVLTDGIVSAWLFEGSSNTTVFDSAGDNDGDINGGVTRVDGKLGKGLQFNGTDAYVEIPDDVSLHLPDAMTVAAWMNTAVSSNHAAIAWKGDIVGWGANFSWRVCTTTAGLTWGRCKAGGEEYFATDGVISTNTWHHVAMVSRTEPEPGTGRYMSAYVDGEDVTGVTGQAGNLVEAPPYLVFEGKPVEIGVGRGIGGTVGNDTYFTGIIDEVLIYDRALEPGEIGQLAAGARVRPYAVDSSGKLAIAWGTIKQ